MKSKLDVYEVVNHRGIVDDLTVRDDASIISPRTPSAIASFDRYARLLEQHISAELIRRLLLRK